MLYLFIILFQLLGIGFHVGQKAMEIDKRTPGDTLGEVLRIFLKENLITLFISTLVLIADLSVHGALDVYTTWPDEPVKTFLWLIPLPFEVPFPIAAILWSFVLGYAGQRLIYKGLGKAESIIEQKLEAKLNT